MESKITFGVWGAVTLLINTICARIFLNFPRQIIEVSGPAAWIVVIYISTLMLLIFKFIEKLFSHFQGMDIIDISEIYIGSVGRIIVGTLVILLLTYICSIILREYAENMKTISLTDSPISFVTTFFLAGMLCGAFFGIEPLIRYHSIMVPVIVAALLFIIIAVIPYFDLSNFAPWFGNGPKNIFGKGLMNISLFSPLLYLYLLPPYIKSHSNFKKSGFLGIILSAIFLLLSTLGYTAVYPYPSNTESFLPTFQLARLINYSRFFQRIEAIFVLAWASSAFMYLSIILFFLAHVFKKTFKLQYDRPLIILFSSIIFILSLLPPNLITAIDLETKYYGYFSWIVTIIMPFIILIIAKVKKKT